MKLRSPIFTALAAIYAESQAGRTGRGTLDVQPSWSELEKRFKQMFHRSLEGEEYELALQELIGCDGTFLILEWENRRVKTTLRKVRVSAEKEREFYAALGAEAPTDLRSQWSALFRAASNWPIPPVHAEAWQSFCTRRAEQARSWQAMDPFRLSEFADAQPLLIATARLLAWNGSSLIRWVSSSLFAESKFLGNRQGVLESLLMEASDGKIRNFEEHGILPMPIRAEFAGPLQLRLTGAVVDYEAQGESTISLSTLEQAEFVSCSAKRCLTVENKTIFLDLARKRSGELIVWTSFPSAATLALLSLLPSTIEFWHFGDTDPEGFHILEDLRCRSGRPFRPFRMHVRSRDESWCQFAFPGHKPRLLTASERKLLNRLARSPELLESRQDIAALLGAGTVGAFEQEGHQPAPLHQWPFY